MEKIDHKAFVNAVETIELYWYGVEEGSEEKEVLRDVLGTLWGMIRGRPGIRDLLRKQKHFMPQ